ncbi:tRNA-dependent cyclodipeptide synthase [Vibrio sp. OCN044]|uniref:Cyclodipeptide synthase n=1 Tax=Vibrio tetraodonis subsp. pristinus TaxID=2695891 RepID=A0A6L8LVB2_9VIBR|nr:tRNA-dependent cyclodipeptide synthase [Vibrio tetraodonis]MYM60011.1 tRNA-dependent cyclodipeptide synthase [Vibrio tetraodonis subsp. pristinus]
MSELAVEKHDHLKKRKRYRTEISRVYPLDMRGSFHELESCFLGISLSNHHFTPLKLEAVLKWVSKRFDSCSLLVGDSVHRLNLARQSSDSEQECLEQALTMGREYIEQAEEIISRLNLPTSFQFVRCSEVQQTDLYKDYYQCLTELYNTDLDYRNSVISSAIQFQKIVPKSLEQAEECPQIQSSIQYFLEEFAIFACLYDQNLPVMLYPGAFTILDEVVRGLHPEAPSALRDLVIVSLRFKGISSMV